MCFLETQPWYVCDSCRCRLRYRSFSIFRLKARVCWLRRHFANRITDDTPSGSLPSDCRFPPLSIYWLPVFSSFFSEEIEPGPDGKCWILEDVTLGARILQYRPCPWQADPLWLGDRYVQKCVYPQIFSEGLSNRFANMVVQSRPHSLFI
jgi:hypothetical protein